MHSNRRMLEPTPRHFWLASLGLFSIARREALTAASIALDEARRLSGRAQGVAADARDIARGALMTVQERVEARVEPGLGRFGAEVESRLAPVLDKFGLPRPARQPVRKPARKPAGSRPQSARRQASARVARKGRG